MQAFITKKIGMASVMLEDGTLSAVTLLAATPNTVTQIKNTETDGYTAVQLGYGEKKNLAKPILGHLKAAKVFTPIMREIRLGKNLINNNDKHQLSEDLEVGKTLTAEVFSVGDVVQVTGTSKGKGWAGTIKRHNFHRQRKTHGGKGNTRKVGSIGSMYPQHIFKGKKMAGQMGGVQVTVKNLKIALVDTKNNIIGVTGAVPGPRKSLVIIKGAK